MKNLLLLLVLMASLCDAKYETITFNVIGQFVPPDIVLLSKGLKAYDDGAVKTAVNYFTRSAKFGNEKAKHMIAVIKSSNNNNSEAYAWLSLMEKSKRNNNLLDKIKGVLSEEEMQNSLVKLQELKEKYNEETSYKRRHKWERNLKGSVGTRLRGIDSVTFRNVQNEVNNVNQVSAAEVKNRVLDYVKNYDPKGVAVQH